MNRRTQNLLLATALAGPTASAITPMAAGAAARTGAPFAVVCIVVLFAGAAASVRALAAAPAFTWRGQGLWLTLLAVVCALGSATVRDGLLLAGSKPGPAGNTALLLFTLWTSVALLYIRGTHTEHRKGGAG